MDDDKFEREVQRLEKFNNWSGWFLILFYTVAGNSVFFFLAESETIHYLWYNMAMAVQMLFKWGEMNSQKHMHIYRRFWEGSMRREKQVLEQVTWYRELWMEEVKTKKKKKRKR